MGAAEVQLAQGNLSAENLKDVVLKLIEMDKAAALASSSSSASSTAASTSVDHTRDPRLRGKSAPHVVDYGHGRPVSNDVKGS